MSLQSLVHRFILDDALPPSAPAQLHPFAPSSYNVPLQSLNSLLASTSELNTSLNLHLQHPASLGDAKLISLYKQQLSEASSLQQIRALLHTLSSRDGTDGGKQRGYQLRRDRHVEYGEDIPLSCLLIPDWIMSRVEEWGRAAGMEVFKETHAQSDHDQFTTTFAGQVLVLDVEFAVFRHPDDPKVRLNGVKTTIAVDSVDSTTKSKSPFTLDALLMASLGSFMGEAQKRPLEQDCIKAAKLGARFQQHMDDLVAIDQLAVPEKESSRSPSVQWFEIIGEAGAVAEGLAKEEWKLMNRYVNLSSKPN